MNPSKKNRQLLAIMLGYSLACLIGFLALGSYSQSVRGFVKLMTSPSQLTLDHFKIATVGGAFLNSGLVGLGSILVFLISGAELAGGSLLAFFLTLGFSFFGINFLNMWLCFFGVWVFCKITRKPFKSQANFALFSTALAPFMSEILWRYPAFDGLQGALVFKAILALVVSVIMATVMILFCQGASNLHHGYTIYNAASGAGMTAVLLFAFMFRAQGIDIPSNTDLGGSEALAGCIFMAGVSCFAIVSGLILDKNCLKDYAKVLKSTGFKCDFTASVGVPLTFVNIGIFGLFVTAYYMLVGANMTGATLGSIICILAAASNGAHILNFLPIMIGYAIASTYAPFTLATQGIVIGFSFSCALAPIAGCFGSLAGVLAGLIHASIVTTVATFHGGFLLYNGGFTSFITAIIMVPVLEHFFAPKSSLSLLPQKK